MSRRRYKMTPYQTLLFEALKEFPGEWMDLDRIWRLAKPEEEPASCKMAAMTTALTHLAEKHGDIEMRQTTRHGKQACFRPMEGSASDSFDFFDSTYDAQILVEALLHYAAVLVEKDRDKSLRAAYLAGLKSKTMGVTPNKVCTEPKRATKKPAAKPSEPEEPAPLTGPPLPADMTYEGFCASARRAYADQAFTYEGVAKRIGLSEEHVRRVIKGETTPTRDTMDKVYRAVFEDYPPPKMD